MENEKKIHAKISMHGDLQIYIHLIIQQKYNFFQEKPLF
jgi:hypothetical protein